MKKYVKFIQRALLRVGIIFINQPFTPSVRQHVRMCDRQFKIVYAETVSEHKFIYHGMDKRGYFVFKDDRGFTQPWCIDPQRGIIVNTNDSRQALYFKYEKH